MIAASATPAASVRLPAFLMGVTPGGVAEAAGVLAAVVVILRLARALGRMSALLAKMAATPAAASAKSSGGGAKRLVILVILGLGGLLVWNTARHGGAAVAAGKPPAPLPTPTPQPTVTRTVAPHAAPHFTFPVHLTGGDVVLIILIGAVVAIVLLGPLLRRSES